MTTKDIAINTEY